MQKETIRLFDAMNKRLSRFVKESGGIKSDALIKMQIDITNIYLHYGIDAHKFTSGIKFSKSKNLPEAAVKDLEKVARSYMSDPSTKISYFKKEYNQKGVTGSFADFIKKSDEKYDAISAVWNNLKDKLSSDQVKEIADNIEYRKLTDGEARRILDDALNYYQKNKNADDTYNFLMREVIKFGAD